MAYFKNSLLFFFLLLSAGCDFYRFHGGRFFERTGRYFPAVSAFEAFAARRPDDPRSAEALVRAGRIYSTQFQRCREARVDFEAALRRFPKLEPWSTQAMAGLLGCPDYFPLEAGRVWVYGDTQSQGRNMRDEWELRESKSGASGEIVSALYAGKKRIQSKTEAYQKKEWAVWRIAGGERTPILKYPFTAGTTWSLKTKQGELVYTIESDSELVKTAAGGFSNCLKVREFNKKFSGSWKYDYYAPGVGRVKTTIAGPGFENPNTELLKFDKIVSP